MRTQKIRARSGVANIGENIREARPRWFGNVERKTEQDGVWGPFKCYIMQMGVGEKALQRCKVQRYKRYEGVGGGPISRKKSVT